LSEPRLIQLSDFHRPEGGSFLPFVRGILRAARERGWKTEAAFFEPARDREWAAELEGEGVAVHFAPEAMRGSRRRLAAWLSPILDRGEAPIVLHTHFVGFDVAAAIAARRRPNVSVVWHLHTPFPTATKLLPQVVVKMAVLGRIVDAMLCPADNIVEEAIRWGAPRGKVHFVPSAIDADAFPLASSSERKHARRELELPLDAAVILHLGWEWRMKGGEMFLRSVQSLVAGGRDDALAVERGGGAEYVDHAERLGISDRLRVLPPVDRIHPLYSAADVLVCSSPSEGMAYALLEALCSGTAVVSTDIPGHAFVGSRVDACRIAGYRPSELAAAIGATLDRDPEVAAAEARAGRTWIVENLSVEVVANQLVDRYESLVADRAVMAPAP
jgi:D-inositol-3-phosphate glycosyltransferase